MRPLNISGSQAKDYYYQKDPLFSKKGDGSNSKWHGEGSRSLGLTGKVREGIFLNIVSGNDPGGNQIVKDGVNGEHRAAVDIPFSPPKSVSIMALHVGDKNLLAAHDKAVEKTIDYLEKNHIYFRKTRRGETSAIPCHLSFAWRKYSYSLYTPMWI